MSALESTINEDEYYKTDTPEVPRKPRLVTVDEGGEPPVVIFSEIDEVYNVMGIDRPPFIDKHYTIDQRRYIDSIKESPYLAYSEELVQETTSLIQSGAVEWYWLSENHNTPVMSEEMGFPSYVECIEPPSLRNVLTPSGFANGKGEFILEQYARNIETRPFVWITPSTDIIDYHPGRFKAITTPYLIITPHPMLGIAPNEWNEIVRFVSENSL